MTIAYNNSDWTAVFQNLKKAHIRWGMISRVLMKKGETLRPHVIMYKEETQSVLMYVSESWFETKAMLKVLEGFHHRAARQITGMMEKCVADGD